MTRQADDDSRYAPPADASKAPDGATAPADAPDLAEEASDSQESNRRGDDRRDGGRRAEDDLAPSEEDERAASEERQGARVRKAIRSELEPPEEDEDDTEVIALRNVSLAFDRPILEDISLAAHKGETVVVVGESGTGKSTILKLILRLLVPDSGQVCIQGLDISHLSFSEALKVRQKMGMVFQGAALFDSMSVFENVAYPLREHTDMSEEEIETRVREKLAFVDLEPDQILDQLPSQLSGGMRKRVGIARGMATDPSIMLYDEPTSGLDPLTTGTVTRLIMKLQRELGVTSVVVSHDIRSTFRMATRVALLADNHIVFSGTPEEMTASDDEYIRDFLGGS